MTDNPTEGTQANVGDAGQPTPAPSTAPQPPPSPEVGESLEDVLKRLDQLEGQLRGFQSGKDKGIAKVSQRVNSLEEQLARYEEYRKTLDPEQARRQLEIDDLLAERRNPGSQQVPDGNVAVAGQQPQATEAHSSIIRAMGLDANNPTVLQAVRDAGNDTAKLAISLSNLATQKAQAAAAPANPAQILPTEGAGAASSETMESLTADLQQLQRQPFTPENMKRRAEIKQKLAGLNPK